ncbi:hypothetical protein [Parabacteroides sp. PF5-6]|uniref:hypothetical protein n=1 Tax=Parabacteroides sp. PF5-6 TaxID=1742403 RepID=UPI002405C831|nr:hypothetical protein [Parabacteroides sp. PF5-6]MDF9830860.1 hypothetical protein [Parabacteroides sp. PF5-6]
MKQYLLYGLLLSFVCLSIQTEAQNKVPTVLPNGIELPEVWPPRYEIPEVRKEMPLPYIDQKPAVIPVNLGRQLFVDDFLIAETNLQRVFHKANFYPANPVLKPDKEWEMTFEGSPYAAPFSDGIWYDERAGKFKMWYLAGAGMIHKSNQSFYTCYAESDDGKHWVKVNQDVYPNTNIVNTSNRDAATVWLDKEEKDPNKRYKFFNVEKRRGGWQIVLRYSKDGIHWSQGQAQSGYVGDRTTFFYNPFTKKWVGSLRYGNHLSGRSRSYLENEDPEMAVSVAHHISNDDKDKNIVFWFSPDDKEQRHPKFPEVEPGIYNFDAIAYESLILGFYAMWKGPENNVCNDLSIQKRNEIGLGYSRDGFHFYRPDHSAFMDVNETEGAWNWGNMQSINGVPLIVGDSLYFYSSGRKRNDIMWDGHTSTGLATLRRDGFVSMNNAKKEGYLLTEKISFDGKYLFVNADVTQGELFVEILDEKGNVIDGFGKNDCIKIKKENSTKHLVSWKNKKDLSELSNKNIRIKFYLNKGDLYAFWISPWETGESGGYTSGGGPGLHPSGRDIPR